MEQILCVSSARISHNIVHCGRPTVLAHKIKPRMDVPILETRLSGKYKLGPRPKGVGRTLITKHQYRAKSYDYWHQVPPEIQSIQKPKLFKKWLKRALKDPKDLPPPNQTNKPKYNYMKIQLKNTNYSEKRK